MFSLCDPNAAVSCWSINSRCDESQKFISSCSFSTKSPKGSDPPACVPGGTDVWIWATQMQKQKRKKRQMTSWRKSIWISQVPKQKTMTLENNCLNLKMWHMSQFKKAGKEHAKTMPDCYMSGWISFRKSHTEDCTKHILSNVLDLWLFVERSFAKQNLYVFCSLLA